METKTAKILNFAELTATIHPINKKNGFWDNENPKGRMFGMVCGEIIGEALEAIRKGKARADRKNYRKLNEACYPLIFSPTLFEQYIKDSFEDETADAAVRIFDLIGGYSLSLEKVTAGADFFSNEVTVTKTVDTNNTDPGYFLMLVNSYVCEAWKAKTDLAQAFYLGCALQALCLVAQVNGFSLNWHIAEKLKYNATRGRMHGNKMF